MGIRSQFTLIPETQNTIMAYCYGLLLNGAYSAYVKW